MFGTCGQWSILSIAWKVADKKLVFVVLFLQLQWGGFVGSNSKWKWSDWRYCRGYFYPCLHSLCCLKTSLFSYVTGYLTYIIWPFKLQISAAARALFNLCVHCRTKRIYMCWVVVPVTLFDHSQWIHISNLTV